MTLYSLECADVLLRIYSLSLWWSDFYIHATVFCTHNLWP